MGCDSGPMPYRFVMHHWHNKCSSFPLLPIPKQGKGDIKMLRQNWLAKLALASMIWAAGMGNLAFAHGGGGGGGGGHGGGGGGHGGGFGGGGHGGGFGGGGFH